jgi:hypothetical protein
VKSHLPRGARPLKARTNLDGLATRLRRDTEEKALREALLVPWRRLLDASEAYVEWRTFALWVRAITETAGDAPAIVRAALELRCPGFLAADRNLIDWRALEEWIATRYFSEAKANGWFTALMYYAQLNPRTEQAWTLWERSASAWSAAPPARWPSFDEWKGESVAKMESTYLREAVDDLLESRAFAIWVSCVSEPEHAISDLVRSEVNRRYPGFFTASRPAPTWRMALLVRLVRSGDARWRVTARQQSWMPTLRYQVLHHPRYRRLIHYRERCRDLWSRTHPNSYPTFTEWLAAADPCYVAVL